METDIKLNAPATALDGLPPIEIQNAPSLACAYGANHITARYCGLEHPPKPPPGIWQHGWSPRAAEFDPAAVIGGYGSYETVKGTERFWVARKDEEDYLRACGYLRAKAIGLPIVYLPPHNFSRLKGSLLVMPVHSLEYTKHDWNFEQYADVIAQVRDRFDEVVACIHPSCWKRGYWLEAFRSRDISIVQGAAGDDRNALLRLQALFSRFEFVTTNGYGSHLAYAAYLGAKVSIYGPYAKFEKRDYANTPLYQACPNLLEPMLEMIEEDSVRRAYPFFFCDPDRPNVQEEWGAEQVGLQSRVSPRELRDLFRWSLPERAKAVAGAPLRKLKHKVNRRLRHTAEYLISPSYREEASEFRDVKQLPPDSAGTTMLYGKPFRFLNKSSFLFLNEEIVRRGIYRFSTADPRPRIIDGGANIGMAMAYFKHLYPMARISAFEPDPTIFSVLCANREARGLSDVDLYQEALWTHSGSMRFMRESSTLGGRVSEHDGSLEIKTRRLKDLLVEPTALLKLDIEGAETDVLEDCGDALSNVDHMFVEYHSFADRPQTIHRLLAVIQKAGFRVHFHVYQPSPQPLFLRTIREGVDLLDMNLDIFCYRS